MRNSLRVQFTLVFIGLARGPLISIAIILAPLGYRIQESRALAMERQVAQRLAVQFEAFIENRYAELQIIASEYNTELKTLNAQTQSNFLNSYNDIRFLDSRGQEIARVNVLTREDLQNRAYLDEVIIPLNTGEAYYSPVWFNPDASEPLITLALPLSNPRSGRVENILSADIRLKSIWNLVSEVASRALCG